MTAAEVKRALAAVASEDKALNNAWFFKTAPGEYGEGDRFIGVTVPQQRRIAKRFKALPLTEIIKLAKSPFHEHRLTAVMIMVYQFENSASQPGDRQAIYEAYMNLLYEGRINNWDIVDSSAHQIIGGWLEDKNRRLLLELAESGDLWQQRAAIISTFHFIRQNDFIDALLVSELMLDHPHDLIHKATGWMLREIGNRDRAVAEEFLNKHYKYMPRTMLRYAIEKFPEPRRRDYLMGRV